MARTRKIDIDYVLNGSGPRRHDQNAIRQLHCFFDVVSDKQDRFLFALPDPNELGAHLQASEKIERAEWFVHVNDVGIGSESPRDLDPPAHAAGKFVRRSVLKSTHSHHVDVTHDDAVPPAMSLFS